MISSLVLLISRIGPWYLKEDELLLSSFTEHKQKYIFKLSSLLTPFHSLEKLLSVIQIHVLSHCVLYQWFWTKRNKNNDARFIEIKCSDEQSQDLQHSLQLSGITLRASGRRSSKEASNTMAWISGYDIVAHVAARGRTKEKWRLVINGNQIKYIKMSWLGFVRIFPILIKTLNIFVFNVPVNPPMDQAYIIISFSWKPSLCTANCITTSMAFASFWGNGTPWQTKRKKCSCYNKT